MAGVLDLLFVRGVPLLTCWRSLGGRPRSNFGGVWSSVGAPTLLQTISSFTRIPLPNLTSNTTNYGHTDTRILSRIWPLTPLTTPLRPLIPVSSMWSRQTASNLLCCAISSILVRMRKPLLVDFRESIGRDAPSCPCTCLEAG